MAKRKVYAYCIGQVKGIADTWAECERIVSGKPSARFKGFEDRGAAERWLEAGADYSIKHVTAAQEGIYFDAGTGAGNGVEINVTDEKGRSLLGKVLNKETLGFKGHFLLPAGVTNNYGELLACKYALQIAVQDGVKEVFGDSKLVIDYWSKWMVKKGVSQETVKLAREVSGAREAFEKIGGKVNRVSGGSNPADLGFHKG
ncbi:MAG: viroplasmin family protein [Candidatus Paceibacterota bacterium]|jgi:ribonuclease HI